MAQLQRDNAILKRAVAIQNGRLQELAGREAELAQLRTVAKVGFSPVQPSVSRDVPDDWRQSAPCTLETLHDLRPDCSSPCLEAS